MNKVLIIGQAPPFQKQKYPYDTTMLYEWLGMCGISKEGAQDVFIFEAMTNKFPGFDSDKSHLKPSINEMDAHWCEVLRPLINKYKKVVLLGRVSQCYYNSQPEALRTDIKRLNLIHPSMRNYSLFQKNKDIIINELKSFLS